MTSQSVIITQMKHFILQRQECYKRINNSNYRRLDIDVNTAVVTATDEQNADLFYANSPDM